MTKKTLIGGFVSGFTASGTLFLAKPIRRPSDFDGSVEKAWKGVGDALSLAEKRHGEVIVKIAGPKTRAHKAA
jgi:hypothetical protein